MAVVVTIAKGYDLGYIWKSQDHAAGPAIGGYYMDAAQAGEPSKPTLRPAKKLVRFSKSCSAPSSRTGRH